MYKLTPFKVEVFNTKANRAMSFNHVGYATVIGAYLRPHWHPYSYSAYHVIFEDGTKDTVYADHCKGVNYS